MSLCGQVADLGVGVGLGRGGMSGRLAMQGVPQNAIIPLILYGIILLK